MKRQIVGIVAVVIIVIMLSTCLVACNGKNLTMGKCIDILEKNGYVVGSAMAFPERKGTTSGGAGSSASLEGTNSPTSPAYWYVSAYKTLEDDEEALCILWYDVSEEEISKILEGNDDYHYTMGQIIIIAKTEEILKDVVKLMRGVL